MKITINGQEKDLISYIKNDMKLKKVTIGITITDETGEDGKDLVPASFTMVIASPDNEWTKPIYVTGNVVDAYTLICRALESVPQPKVKSTNVDEVEVVEKAAPKAKAALAKKEVKKKVPVIDWSGADKYIEMKDWLRAKYTVNVTLRNKHIKDVDAIELINGKLDEIEKLSAGTELFADVPQEIKEIAKESPNIILATIPKHEDTNEPENLDQ